MGALAPAHPASSFSAIPASAPTPAVASAVPEPALVCNSALAQPASEPLQSTEAGASGATHQPSLPQPQPQLQPHPPSTEPPPASPPRQPAVAPNPVLSKKPPTAFVKHQTRPGAQLKDAFFAELERSMPPKNMAYTCPLVTDDQTTFAVFSRHFKSNQPQMELENRFLTIEEDREGFDCTTLHCWKIHNNLQKLWKNDKKEFKRVCQALDAIRYAPMQFATFGGGFDDFYYVTLESNVLIYGHLKQGNMIAPEYYGKSAKVVTYPK
eukprot:NODE_1534_length_947_cov_182.955457_g1070_i0.p1 GENE.NODE_1534_length_947_cov_182.955457_g1070_i0~~NODE_1534_length_947_cov_182.955457_g1070_i0.p1  ORF type:complete len:276 (+),score=41.60 NODE_1534_length_947_cov_182.955457_g1070_i0:28-828(+)